MEEGLSADVASGGEFHLALQGGFAPERCYMHGNNKTEAELVFALERGIGHIVVDSFDEIDRLERLAPGQKVMLRVTPGIKPDTHAKIQTGQEDSKFGFGLDDVPRAIERIKTLELRGLHAHIGSQVFDLEPFERLARGAVRDGRLSAAQPGRRPGDRLHRRPGAAVCRELRGRPAGERPRGRDGALRARALDRRATRA